MRKGHLFVRFGRHGRLMKDDQQGGGGAAGTQSSGGDNGGGNSGDSSNSGGDSNNNGQQFDPAAFWAGPADEGANGGGGDSNGQSSQQQQGEGSGGGDLQTTLSQRLENMSFGEPIFNDEIAAQINQGNFEGVQERFNGALQQAVRQSLAMNVQILRPFAEQLMQQVREEFQGTLGQRDNNEALEQNFPAAKNPAARPMIQSVYEQALKNSKGNKAEAVKQTKEMLRFMAGATADDLGIDVAPRGSGDSGRPQQSYNWLDDLTGRA